MGLQNAVLARVAAVVADQTIPFEDRLFLTMLYRLHDSTNDKVVRLRDRKAIETELSRYEGRAA